MLSGQEFCRRFIVGEKQLDVAPDIPVEFVFDVEMALLDDNAARVDQLVAELTRNRVHAIDQQSYTNWRGIARGDFVGVLEDAIHDTLTRLGWRPRQW